MNWKSEGKALAGVAAVFLACYHLPAGAPRFDHAVLEALHLVKWYAREHVLLCLVPAFFIAGGIAVFVRQAAVMKYLGANAPKPLAYGVASVSGTLLAVCSCTVLPLFAGIYRMGAGLGPATAFLYSGPAINVLAIVMTARVLGLELGIARAVAAVAFSVVIGLLMHLLFRHEALEKVRTAPVPPPADAGRPLWQTALFFTAMAGVLVLANWGKPGQETGIWYALYAAKWPLTGLSAAMLAGVLVGCYGVRWWKVLLTALAVTGVALAAPEVPLAAFSVGVLGLALITQTESDELRAWGSASWDFAKQILPLLLLGVLAAGLLLGRPGGEGLIPARFVATLVGGNSLWANLFASVLGAFMYFATLTEVPILLGLLENGMGQGPALALLLAGPALSLPSMLVLRSIMGTRKTIAFVLIVVAMATISGMIFGVLVD